MTLVEASAQPLERAIGTTAGAFIAALHREAGIDLRTNTTVTDFQAGADGRLTGVRLSDGSLLPADVAVLALGAVPATGWLAGSGLALEGGVHCDDRLRALRPDGSVVPGVFAAGDVARVPQPLAGGAPLALGHWTNAVEQGTAAAHALLSPTRPSRSPASRPSGRTCTTCASARWACPPPRTRPASSNTTRWRAAWRSPTTGPDSSSGP